MFPPRRLQPGLSVLSSLEHVAACSTLRRNPKNSGHFQWAYDKNNDFAVMLLESAMSLYWQLRCATSGTTVLAALSAFYHTVSGHSVAGTALRLLHSLVVEVKRYMPWHQSGTSWIDIMDDLYGNTRKVVKSALGDKIAKVFNHVVALALYKRAGVELDPVLFGDLEKRRIRPTVWDVASFADAITGLVLFLCKSGRQALSTGNIDCFFIDEEVLSKWVERASRLRKDYEFTGNPSAIGMALPQYIRDIQDTVAEGKNLQKHFRKGRDSSLLLNIILELECIEKRLNLSMMAASFRRAPIGILLYGGAGVAKSMIALGLFHHYCAIRGIPKEGATMWTRTEGEEYYSGYKSHYAGVLYDDAAKYRTNKIQGIDPSIGDIISAINNVQFVTPQADLPDKGKIPFRSEWVGVTSNVDDLNSAHYFNCTAAFLRRFAVRIVPKVKPEYCVEGEERIDPAKIPKNEQYPDLWTFKVDVPVVKDDQGYFKPLHTFEHYADLLVYMTGVYEKHIEKETRLLESVGTIGPEELCDCRLPKSICRCEQVEDGSMLFRDATAVVQSDGPCTAQHWPRVAELNRHRHVIHLAHAKEKVVLAFLQQVYADPLISRWFDPLFCDREVSEDDDDVARRVIEHIDTCVEEFLAVDSRDRLNHLSDGAFARASNTGDLSYLSFTPKFGRRCSYLESATTTIRDSIVRFTPTFSAKELALLDVYIAEEAPKHISNGWNMGSIVRGGYDYVKHFSREMEDPERVEVREFLMGTREKVWYERLGVQIAIAYFEKQWVYNTVNYLTQYRVFQYAAAYFIDQCAHPRSRLMMEGARIDQMRGGVNSVLITAMSAATLIGTIAVLYNIYSRFGAADKPEEVSCASTVASECGESECSSEDDGVAQMDLDSVGKLPQPREDDKVNVWVTKERAITRLDVHPKRPHNESQILSAVAHNVVFCRVYSHFPGGKGYANTRALVVDSETLVLNNHALPAGSVVEVWLGPVHAEGVRPSFKFNVSEDLVTRHPSRDIAIVKTWAMPHRFKDIKHTFTNRSYESVGPSEYLVRHTDNSLEQLVCIGVTLSGLRGLAGAENVVCQAWSVRPQRQTIAGECGSPLVVHSTLGSVIVGIHAGYDVVTNTAWAVRLYREDFDNEHHPEIGYIVPASPIAQVGGFLSLKPNDKLYTDYHRSGHLMTHGQLRGFIARPKFTGKHTPHAHYCFSHGEEFDPPIEDNMAAPRNAGWRQPQMILENYLQPTHDMNEMIVRACVEALKCRITEGLTEADLEDIHPVPISVAVNGMPRVPNVDAQKHATSAGHGKRGPKLQYLTEPVQCGVWESFREFDAATLAEIDTMRENMYRGVRPHAIYDACWKNEMLSKAKVEAGRARCIYMCPLAFLVNMRMSTVAMCRVMIRRRNLFCIAVGLNTHSEEWDDIYRESQRIPGDNWIAGDFKAFESVLGLLLSNAVSKVFIHLAVLSKNYSAEELMALRVELADVSNATINFFGELITLLGGEASGQQLTTFFNCLANVLLHMYAYVVIHSEQESYVAYLRLAREFFDMVFCNTLGDDVYLKVDPSRAQYNHTAIQSVFGTIGITYTMADKNAPSIPYIPLEEVTFLKRKFVDHEAFPDTKVAALDKRSIYKMLCYTVPSHSVSEAEQMASALCSAQAEAFFHGSAFFAQIQDLIAEMPKSAELEFRMSQLPPPSWNGMMARFLRSSPRLQVEHISPVCTEKVGTEGSYCHVSALELQTEWRVDPWGSTVMERSSDHRLYDGARPCAKKTPRRAVFEVTLSVEFDDFSKNINKTTKNPPTTEDREMAPKVVVQAINKVRSKNRRSDRRKNWSGVAQADFQYDTVTSVNDSGAGSIDHVQEQVVFKNEPAGVKIVAPTSKDSIAGSMKIMQDVGSYLNRPRLIYTFTWPENGTLGPQVDFNPWALFFNDQNMINKLTGYSLMRCKLILKLLINGSPFYYGSLLVTYTPLNGYRLDTANSSSLNCRLTASSQKPHVWLENQNCSTAQMELPFLYPYPYMRVTELDALENMGTVHFITYAPLLSANGVSSSNVDIQVYAWAEDVELSGPSDLPVLQSEFKRDGQISGPASAVASVASKLKNAPMIGPYAKATEMVASAVGDVAHFFGFTNVPNVSDVASYKNIPFSLASTEISEPVQKLSLQAKQETAIGASQHGGGTGDDLHIKSFCSRSAYISQKEWSTTDSPGTLLWTVAVSPQMYQRDLATGEIAHSPMSYAANFFQYWRGSIKYTFKVVRSPYHRGRLQVTWDAAARNWNQAPTLGNPNTLTTIMDLDEDSECSFVVPYMQNRLFTDCYQNAGIPPNTMFSVAAAPSGNWSESNGILSVRVLNRLTAPESSSSATILVFASACDDIEFAGPRDYTNVNGNTFLSVNPSTTGVIQSDVQYDDSGDAAELMPRGASDDLYLQVFGEKVASFREYMHRSSLSALWYPGDVDTSVGSGAVRIPIKRMPPPPGVADNGWWLGTTTAGAGQRVFYTKMHPIVALSSCFIGYKGSVNVNVNVDQPSSSLAADTLAIYRLQNGKSLSAANRRPSLYVYSNPAVSAAVNARGDLVASDAGRAGLALTNTKTNAGLSAQLPYYSSSAFQMCDARREYSNTDNFTDRNSDWWRIEWRYNKDSSTTSSRGSLTSIYYATGPDFDLIYFINVPVLTAVSITAV